MPNPKYRFSKSRTRKRRSQFKAEMPTAMVCPNCGTAVHYHHVCPGCGHYRGRLAIEKNQA